MRAKFGRGPTVMSEKGAYRQTHAQTKGRCSLVDNWSHFVSQLLNLFMKLFILLVIMSETAKYNSYYWN